MDMILIIRTNAPLTINPLCSGTLETKSPEKHNSQGYPTFIFHNEE
jgi:hypothetical protein